MDFSYYSHGSNFSLDNGYSVCGYEIIQSLNELGHHVYYNSEKPPVQFMFVQPSWASLALRDDQYQVLLVPWESTELPEDWPDVMQDCNEVWATSDWVKQVFESNGIPVSKVFHHGVSSKWKPKRRKFTLNETFKFLHQGSESERKGGQEVYNAFKDLYGNRRDVHLYLKCKDFTLVRPRLGEKPLKEQSNVTVISRNLPEEELIDLYYRCHVLVYPSNGEGFGMTPAQALATGMPTICTEIWAPYKKYIQPFGLDSKLHWFPWQQIHPGHMYKVDQEQLMDYMEQSISDYEEWLSGHFFRQAFDFHREYNQLNLTAEAFKDIFEKFDQDHSSATSSVL